MSASTGGLANLIPDFDPRRTPLIGRDHELPPIAPERLSLEALRRRLAAPPAWEPEFLGDPPWRARTTPRTAAVLVPIVAHPDGATILLTERAAHLRGHAGQVAFPGGGCDPGDASAVETALREAYEEVGLQRERVEVIAQLPQYLTGSNYLVTPVVGIVEPGFDLRLDPFEVAEAFEVPIGFLMDPRHHERRHIVMQGMADRPFYAMPWHDARREREHFIWGATAAMLRNLYRLLSA